MRMKRLNLDMVGRTWEYALPCATKAVLQAYCWHCNDQGVCWPSVARIAQYTGLNARTVQRRTRELETAGALVCIPHAKTSSKTYRINLDALEQSQRLTSQLQPDLPGMEEPDAPELGGWPQLCGDLPPLPPLMPSLQPDLPGLEVTATPAPQDWPVLDFAAPLDLASPCAPVNPARTDGAAPPQEPQAQPASAHTSHVLPALATQPDPAPQPQAAALENSAQGVDVGGAGQDQQPDPDTLRRFAKLSQRKGHGPVTADTLASLRAEGARAGLSLPDVLALCLERRWGTFKALWLSTHHPAHHDGHAHPPGGWTVPGGVQPDLAPDLTPAGRAAARILADLQAATQQPLASPTTVAHHRANLAKLRADYVADMASRGRSSRQLSAVH